MSYINLRALLALLSPFALSSASSLGDPHAVVPEGIYVNAYGDVVAPESFSWGHYAAKEKNAARPVIPGHRLYEIGRLHKRQQACPTDFPLPCPTDISPACCHEGQTCCGVGTCCISSTPICCNTLSLHCCGTGQFCQGASSCCNIGQVGCGEACCNAGETCCGAKCCGAGFTCSNGECTNSTSTTGAPPTSTSTSQSSTPTPTTPTPSSDPPTPGTGTIVGAAVGSVLLVIMLLAAFILYRRRNSKSGVSWGKEDRHHKPDVTFTIPIPPEGHDSVTITEAGPPSGAPWAVPERVNKVPVRNPLAVPPPATPSKATYDRARSVTSVPAPVPSSSTIEPNRHLPLGSTDALPDSSRDAPPVYGNSTVLVDWANSNRDVVSEDMAAKLLAAGYMPSDNPDTFTEDEWQTRYGISRLELLRLRRLYERDHRDP